VLIDLHEWGGDSTRSSAALPVLRRLVQFWGDLARFQNAALTGTHETISAQEHENGRITALREIESDIMSGNLDASLTGADYAYALHLLHAGAGKYAATAEVETKAFLGYMVHDVDGDRMIDLTKGKGVNQPGPDGMFIGGFRALGLAEYMGLEVKTAVTTKSLGNNIRAMIERNGKEDRQAWRNNSFLLAVAALRKMGEVDIARKLSDAGPGAFATVLVARACTLDEVKVPAVAYEIFDRVLSFDLFGYPIWDHQSGLTDIEFQAISDLARDFNTEKFRMSIPAMERMLK
jgi:hypothetical protein